MAKVAITGTSKGVGLELSKMFIADGWDVYGCSRTPPPLSNPHYNHELLDLSDVNEAGEWMRKTYSAAGHLDLVLCNAAAVLPGLALGQSDADLLAQIEINFLSPCRIMQEYAKSAGLKRARLVVFSSIAIEMLDSGTSAYSAAKAALETYVCIFARELRATQTRFYVIRVPIISTGAGKQTSQVVIRRILDRVTLNQPATESDLYGVIKFLTKDDAEYLTGTVISLGIM